MADRSATACKKCFWCGTEVSDEQLCKEMWEESYHILEALANNVPIPRTRRVDASERFCHISGAERAFGADYQCADEHVDAETLDYRLNSLVSEHASYLRSAEFHSKKAVEEQEYADGLKQQIEVLQEIKLERGL